MPTELGARTMDDVAANPIEGDEITLRNGHATYLVVGYRSVSGHSPSEDGEWVHALRNDARVMIPYCVWRDLVTRAASMAVPA